MAWIESHQESARHPKTRKLARLLDISIPTTVGHLHILWHWALDWAQDGCLDSYDASDLADAAMWDGDAEEFLAALLAAGYIEMTESGLMLHDWYDYAGKLIERRRADAARKRQPSRADTARQAQYSDGAPSEIQEKSEGFVTDSISNRNLNPNPNRNPNPVASHPKTEVLQPSVSAAAPDDASPPLPRAAPKPKDRVTEDDAAFHERFWPAWPRKVAKAEALHSWRTLRPDAATVERILAAIPRQCAALDWPREGYRYCPHPATWLRARRWEDEVPPVALGGNGARASPNGAARGRETLSERNRRAFEEAFGHGPDDVPDAIDAAFRSHEPRPVARADPTLVAEIRRSPRRGA